MWRGRECECECSVHGMREEGVKGYRGIAVSSVDDEICMDRVRRGFGAFGFLLVFPLWILYRYCEQSAKVS